MTPDDTKPITKAECDPRGKGCMALALTRAEVILERTELLTLLGEKVDSKAYSTDIDKVMLRLDKAASIALTSLISVLFLLLAVIFDIVLRVLAK